ncbi:hypothetical protein, partial [Staphylococcus pasteuri]|uniref:hypothetical protein n=1 Tax=Staphylococcus pasteuri TaxID=45972 RepID=UPI001C99C9FD
SLNTTNPSPASPTSLIPLISTPLHAPPLLIPSPKSFTIPPIPPYLLPTTIQSPSSNLPFSTNTDAAPPPHLSNS